MPAPQEMSRDELITLVGRQDGQISAMAGQIADLIEANEALAVKLARLEHLLSRTPGTPRALRRAMMIRAGRPGGEGASRW